MDTQINTAWSEVINRLDSWWNLTIVNLPNMILAITILVFFFWLGRMMQRWLKRPVRRLSKQPSVQNLIIRTISLLVASLGFLLALGVLNLDTVLKSILAGAGVAGLAVGLALQGTLSNTFSGVLLAVKEVINVGDWIESNGFAGVVEKIELRNTWIREADNNMVIIPNKDVLETPFKNYGLTEQIRVILKCGIGYDEDLKHVKDVAIEAINRRFHDGRPEEVEFYYTDFGDSSINFMLRFWVDAKEKLTILESRSESIMTIKKAFDRENINIPFPIRTLEVKSEDKQFINQLANTIA